MAWPQPALENISIQASWDGDPDHPADVHVTIEFTSLPSSKLRLIQHEHPRVKSIEIVAVERTMKPMFFHTTSRSSSNSFGQEISATSFLRTGPQRMLFTPPRTSEKNAEPHRTEYTYRQCEDDDNTPKPHGQAQQQLQRRKYSTSETPSGTKLVPYPPGESTASTVEFSPPSSLPSSEAFYRTESTCQKSPAPPHRRSLQLAKRPRQTAKESRIPLLRQTRPPQPTKSMEDPPDPKPVWRVPAAGDSIFPRGRRSVLNITTPRRVSRSADARMVRHLQNTKWKPRSRLMRSSSFEAPRYRDLTVQVNPRETVAHWLQNNTAPCGSSEKTNRYSTLLTPHSIYSSKGKLDRLCRNGVSENQENPANTLQPSSPILPSESLQESFDEFRSCWTKGRPTQSGTSNYAAPLQSHTSTAGKIPIIQDIDTWKWVVCLPGTEEETWSVDLKAAVLLERLPQGGHMLDIPGLPQQAGDLEGNYTVTLQDPGNASQLPKYGLLRDRVKLVKTPSILKKLHNGERHGTFSLEDNFSLRFLLFEHNRFLNSEDFNIEYVVHEDCDTKENGTSIIAYSLICDIRLNSFMCWAEEVTFTLFIYGSPWDGAVYMFATDDFTINMGHASGDNLDKDLVINFTRHLVDLSKPLKVTWTQEVGASFTRLTPSVSTRPRDNHLRIFCRPLQASTEVSAVESPPHDSNTTPKTLTRQRCLLQEPIQDHRTVEASEDTHAISKETSQFDLDRCDRINESGSDASDLNPYSGWDCFPSHHSSPSSIVRITHSTTHRCLRYHERLLLFAKTMPLCCFSLFTLFTIMLIVMIAVCLESAKAPDFSAALIEYRQGMANLSKVRNLPEEWWRLDPWQAYMETEWGVELVDVKGDPTGWKTLMRKIGEGRDGNQVQDVIEVETEASEHGDESLRMFKGDETGDEEQQSGEEKERIKLGTRDEQQQEEGEETFDTTVVYESEEMETEGEMVEMDGRQMAQKERDMADQKQRKGSAGTNSDDDESDDMSGDETGDNDVRSDPAAQAEAEVRGTLGRARDVVDFALGWRPLD